MAITIALILDLAINVSLIPPGSIDWRRDPRGEGRPRTRGYTWMQTISGSFEKKKKKGVAERYAIGAVFRKFRP